MSERTSAAHAASSPTAPVGDERPARRWLLAALALALLLRLVSWWQSTLMMNDGPDFLWQAGQMLAGHWDAALSHPYLPLYAAATAGVARLVGDLVVAGLTVSILSGLLLVLASWGFGRRVPGARVIAPCAALAAAINVRAVNYTADIQSDGLFAALALCALWAMWTSRERKGCARSALAAGALSGLAYLTRYEGLYLCVPWAWLLGVALVGGRARVPMLRATLAFVVGVLACVLPYVLEVHALTDAWALSIKPSALRMGLTDADEFLQAPPDSPLGWPFIPSRRASLAAGAEARADGAGSEAEAEAEAETETETETADGTHSAPSPGAEPGSGPTGPSKPDGKPATPAHDDGPHEDAARTPDDPAQQADDGTARGASRTPDHATSPTDGTRPAWTAAGVGGAAALASHAATAVGAVRPAPSLPLLARDARMLSPFALVAEILRGFLHTLRGEAFVLALAGGCVLFRRRRELLGFLLVTSVGWLGVLAIHLHVNGYLSNRHYLTAIVPMLPLCGAGIAWFAAPVTWRRVVLGLALFESVRAGTWPQREDKQPRLDALAWVAEHTRPEQWFLTQRRRDGFYAGRRAIVTNMPCRDVSVLKKLREYDVPYAVFSLDTLEHDQPEWLDGTRFAEVTRFSDAGETVLVLRPTFVELEDGSAGR
ncbi:MAG: glycosyltransferase family 39 protein [Planctomycetes bacterium]|nr:glycosyltransferase family 39 protein [Planctomycetota bacterium]